MLWGVGDLGKQTEGSYISKGMAGGISHIHSPACAVGGDFCLLGNGFGQVQTAGEVVGASHGQVAHHGAILFLQLEQTGNHLVEGSVTAAAHKAVVSWGQFAGGFQRVAGACGGNNGEKIALSAEHAEYLCQNFLGTLTPCVWIVDIQQFFHNPDLCLR